jgi:hypothetical protein
MERHTQSVTELKGLLSEVQTDWKDNFTLKFMTFLGAIPSDESLDETSIIEILDADFDNARHSSPFTRPVSRIARVGALSEIIEIRYLNPCENQPNTPLLFSSSLSLFGLAYSSS